jgi:lipopolysaccharide export LptBFGC system permease protein LptF
MTKEPGALLLLAAKQLLSPRGVERVAEPALADLQREWHEARVAGDRGRAAVIRIAGSLRFWQAVLRQSTIDAWRAPEPSQARDVSLFLLVRLTLTTFLVLATLFNMDSGRPDAIDRLESIRLFVYFLPAYAVFLLPMSLLPGVLLALRISRHDGASEGRIRVLLLRASTGVAVSMFLLSGWVVPVSNQVARQRIFSAVTRSREPLAKGSRELTLGELSATLDRLASEHNPREAGIRVEFHKRFALPAASFVFVLLAFGLRRWGLAKGIAQCTLSAWVILGLYCWMAHLGEIVGGGGALPAVVAAWMPNAVLAALAVALLAPSQRPGPAGYA